MTDLPLLTRSYAGSRVALGTALALAPGAARPWIGSVAREADVRGPLRVLGVRDALLGVAVFATAEAPTYRRRALLLCAVADAADALVCTADFLRTRRLGAAFAAATAAGGAAVGLFTANATKEGDHG